MLAVEIILSVVAIVAVVLIVGSVSLADYREPEDDALMEGLA